MTDPYFFAIAPYLPKGSHMKYPIFWIVAHYLLVLSAAANTGGFVVPAFILTSTSEQPLLLELTTFDKRSEYLSGEAITLEITVKNADKGVLYLPQSCVSVDYRLSVRKQDDKSPSVTPKGEKLTSPYETVCSRKRGLLLPGASKRFLLKLTEIYDLSQKGEYRIKVSRSARDQKGQSKIYTSPAILVRIV